MSVLAGLPRGPEIADDTPDGAALRARITDIIMNSGFDREYETDGIILGTSYEGSPICWPDGSAPPADQVMSYSPTARPGHRAPHAELADGSSTLDLFGRGLVVLRFDPAAALDGLPSAASKRGVPLEVIDIGDPGIAALYQRALVMVRPDGQVAWRDDAAPADAGAVIDRVVGA